jgi:NTP pyrophosphatase (non-canonical NTP hydrolase)
MNRPDPIDAAITRNRLREHAHINQQSQTRGDAITPTYRVVGNHCTDLNTGTEDIRLANGAWVPANATHPPIPQEAEPVHPGRIVNGTWQPYGSATRLDVLTESIQLFRDMHVPDQGLEAAATKVAHEAGELAQAWNDHTEAADVLITLIGWCEAGSLGFDQLVEAAIRKMVVNHSRKWKVMPDGTAQHVGVSNARP